MPIGLGLGIGLAFGGSVPEIFDVYVDSVNGDDGNDGLTPATALQSLSAIVLANDFRIGLARGSTWRDDDQFIDDNTKTGVRVGAYGSGDDPVIDCSTVLTGFVAGSEPDVYVVEDVALIGSGTHYTHVQWNGHILQGTTSEADCSAQPGSFYITGQSGTVDIYVHAPGSVDLSGAYAGEVAYGARECAIRLGDGATVRAIETANNRHNDGSIVVGDNSLIEYNRIRNGGKHNMLAGYGSRVRFNEILEAHNHVESGILVVIYTGTAPGGSDLHSYIERNTFTLRGLYASPSNQSCTYCHTSSGTVAGNLYVRGNAYIDVFGALDAGAGNISGDLYWEDNYVTIAPGYAALPYSFPSPYLFGGTYVRNNKFYFPEPYATTFTAADKLIEGGRTMEVDDNDFGCGPYFRAVVFATGGTPSIKARRNRGGGLASFFIRMQTSMHTLDDVSGNIIGCGLPIYCTGTTAINNCDGNHWTGASGFRKNSTDYTWANWVSAGHDVASNAGGDSRGAEIPRSAAVSGILGDWPHTLLHISAENSASVTETTPGSGLVSSVADLSYGGRNLILHEPTPGTDKVSWTEQGGKKYFAPVAAGGLKLASQDFNSQLSVFAAVVRLNAALSSAITQQTLLSYVAGDGSAVKLGVISGAFADGIVTFQNGGASGFCYASASDTYLEDTPHLIVAYRDPVTNTTLIRIDGVAIATMTNVGSYGGAFLVPGVKDSPLMLMRGITSANSLDGYLGELFLGGPMSLDVVADIEAQMIERWGIS